jgi:hypothetical protein
LLRDSIGIRPEYYKLLPMLCNHESNELEPHLARDCAVTLAFIAEAIMPLSVIPVCLESISQVAKSSSWKAKASVLELLQVCIHVLPATSLLRERNGNEFWKPIWHMLSQTCAGSHLFGLTATFLV